MNKLITISFCLLLGIQYLCAQKTLELEIRDKKKEVIYMNIDNNNLEFFIDNNNNENDSRKNVNSKENHINLYLKWANPLRYKLTWKDSILDDERDKLINDFVSMLVGQFGSSVTDLNIAKSQLTDNNDLNENEEIRGVDFSDKDLLLLLVHLRANQRVFVGNEIESLNDFFKQLKTFDNGININVSDEANNIYLALFNMKNFNDYEKNYQLHKDLLETISDRLSSFDKDIKILSDGFKKLSISDTLLKSYTDAVLKAYFERSMDKLKNDKKIIEKLKSIFNIIDSSIVNPSSKHSGYFKIRSVDFDNGNKLETVLLISEYEFKKETSEFSKKSEILNKKFVFKKYDFFDISVSTGLFFGNTTLRGYGVSNDGTTFTVTEDDINNNSAVAAIFLNFNFKTSRYFSPLFQLGVDPTKKRPFMLVGTGFSIPVAKLAISGGPIWTWNQSLKSLKVGETITSTTELEKDISYKFDASPKGWYIGIQYNF